MSGCRACQREGNIDPCIAFEGRRTLCADVECRHPEAEHAPCSLTREEFPSMPFMVVNGRCSECGMRVSLHAQKNVLPVASRASLAPPPSNASPIPASCAEDPIDAAAASVAAALVAPPPDVADNGDDVAFVPEVQQVPAKKQRRHFNYVPVLSNVKLFEAKQYVWEQEKFELQEEFMSYVHRMKQSPCTHGLHECLPYMKKFFCHASSDASLNVANRRRNQPEAVTEFRRIAGDTRCGVLYRFTGCILLTSEVKRMQTKMTDLRHSRGRAMSETVNHILNLPPYYVDQVAIGTLSVSDASTHGSCGHEGHTKRFCKRSTQRE